MIKDFLNIFDLTSVDSFSLNGQKISLRQLQTQHFKTQKIKQASIKIQYKEIDETDLNYTYNIDDPSIIDVLEEIVLQIQLPETAQRVNVELSIHTIDYVSETGPNI